MPVDLYYCEHCKLPQTLKVTEFLEAFKKCVSQEFYKRVNELDEEVKSYIARFPKNKLSKTRHVEYFSNMTKKRELLLQEIADSRMEG